MAFESIGHPRGGELKGLGGVVKGSVSQVAVNFSKHMIQPQKRMKETNCFDGLIQKVFRQLRNSCLYRARHEIVSTFLIKIKQLLNIRSIALN